MQKTDRNAGLILLCLFGIVSQQLPGSLVVGNEINGGPRPENAGLSEQKSEPQLPSQHRLRKRNIDETTKIPAPQSVTEVVDDDRIRLITNFSNWEAYEKHVKDETNRLMSRYGFNIDEKTTEKPDWTRTNESLSHGGNEEDSSRDREPPAALLIIFLVVFIVLAIGSAIFGRNWICRFLCPGRSWTGVTGRNNGQPIITGTGQPVAVVYSTNNTAQFPNQAQATYPRPEYATVTTGQAVYPRQEYAAVTTPLLQQQKPESAPHMYSYRDESVPQSQSTSTTGDPSQPGYASPPSYYETRDMLSTVGNK